MNYPQLEEAEFISRPNRFIAKVLIKGREETVHVANTGRCRELLVPGARVYLSVSDSSKRKTKYDLVAVKKGELLINMDSGAPNKAFYDYACQGLFIAEPDKVRKEVTWGKSRLDFCIEKGERRCYIEVKGVTLERDGVALFPDAPTERGLRHLHELISASQQGCEACIVFIIQFYGAKYFTPNAETQAEFAQALRKAQEAGVKVIAYRTAVTPNSMCILDEIPVKL